MKVADNPHLDEDLRALVDQVMTFCEKEVRPVGDTWEREEQLPRALARPILIVVTEATAGEAPSTHDCEDECQPGGGSARQKAPHHARKNRLLDSSRIKSRGRETAPWSFMEDHPNDCRSRLATWRESAAIPMAATGATDGGNSTHSR